MKTKIFYTLLPTVTITILLICFYPYIRMYKEGINPFVTEKWEYLPKLAKLTTLPTDESPKIEILSDIETLKSKQEFFKDAQDGDILFTYASASKAYLYSPVNDLIVNEGPADTERDNEIKEETFEDRYLASQSEYTELNRIAPFKFEDFAVPLSNKLPPTSEMETKNDYGQEEIGWDDNIFINYFAGKYTFFRNRNGTAVHNSFVNYFDNEKFFPLTTDMTAYIFFRPDSRLLITREDPHFSTYYTSVKYSKYDYVYTYYALGEEDKVRYLGTYVFVDGSFKEIKDEKVSKEIRDYLTSST